jgi:hypothetical protein
MYRSSASTGDSFWVDWATLNPNPVAVTDLPVAEDSGQVVAGTVDGTQ